MPGEKTSPEVQPTGRGVRVLIIVARDQPDYLQSLRNYFAGDQDVEVVLDRRLWERRQWIRSYAPNRRGPDRRGQPRIESDPRARQLVIVRPPHWTHLS